MNNEIALRIPEALYRQWFTDYLNGIQSFQLNFTESPNEILQTFEALENNYLIIRNQVGWYIITIAGIDVFEENLSPSSVSKIVTERRNIMEVVKKMYDVDIHKTMDHETIMSKIDKFNV